jgi:hypothetical protein
VISTATSIVLTLLLVWAAATAVIVGAGTFSRRFTPRRPRALDLTVDERGEELRWTAVRFLGHGIAGEQLQEAVCQATNCTPAEATFAIAQSIDRTIDDPPRS